MYVSEHMPVLQVLQLFRKNILHFAVVIDEYGGFSGIITPYDILQAIVGELPVSVETKVPMISKLFENVWEIDGSLPIQEFKVFFDIEEMPDEQRYGTISGFVIMLFGHIPKNGEKKDWNGYEFTISKMKNHRISKLQVHRADKSI
jgi:putative hemolysin